ncbi:MAG: winged helix-turn-helix domain-containing tetratricopeptide repeat protein [Terriglobales bacterium]
MAQPVPTRLQIQFGPFTADLRTGELLKYGIHLKLQDRPFAILVMLLEHPGEIVTREEMQARLWPEGTFVDFDNNISSAIGKLRAALGDSAAEPRYVETVGRGYRFAAEVKLIAAPATSLPESPAAGPELVTKPQITAAPTAKAHLPGRPWLRVTLLACLLAAAAAIGYLQWLHFQTSSPAVPGRMMLAVLPFSNLTGDAAQDYFSDGFTEEMITQLGRLDPAHLGVIARTSVMSYKNGQQHLDRIGRELGVQYVLEGSVRRDSNHVRITAQLVQVNDQTHLFAREYDRELKEVLVLQNEIAQEIADEIQLALSNRKKTEPSPQPSLSPQAYEAYDLYLKGRYFWNKRTAEGFRQAAEFFQQATARDPGYARAYAGLADSYALMSSYYLGPQNELMPKARAAALKALEINDGLAEAHTSLALISENYDWDWPTAEKEYRRAIQLDPNYATAHQWYAEFLAFEGRFNEALAESERARQLDPLSLIIAVDRGAIFYYARDYDRAIAQLGSVLAMSQTMPRTEGVLASAYAEQGRLDDALKVIDHLERTGDLGWGLGHQAHVLFRAGQHARALQTLAKAEQAMRRRHLDPSPMLATMYAGMGEKDEAFVWLQRTFQDHSSLMTSLKVDPMFDPLRSDPRFQNLLRRVGLVQ